MRVYVLLVDRGGIESIVGVFSTLTPLVAALEHLADMFNLLYDKEFQSVATCIYDLEDGESSNTLLYYVPWGYRYFVRCYDAR